MTARRVAVTGIGLITPHGDDPEPVFNALLGGESMIRLFEPEDTPLPVAIPAAYCTHFDGIAKLGRSRANGMDRFSQMGTCAAEQAWQDAGLHHADGIDKDGIGVLWGTGGGGINTTERSYRDLFLRGKTRISPVSVVLGMSNAAASNIAIGLGLGGANFTYSVACASSAIAIGEAFRRIRSGESTIMLAGGSETPLAYGVIRAWESLMVLAPGDETTSASACRPFHPDRQGLVLAEGAGALVLEDWEHAVRRGARIYAELAGYGMSCDHSHLSRPDAAGQVRALKAALRDSAMRLTDIGYVNAHGTATREGDAIEIAALRECFGEHAGGVHISSTKSMHGHAMGAAGAIEAIVTLLAVARQSIPPTANLETPAEECRGMRHVTTAVRDFPLKAALSNSFAFGGSNAVLAFRQAAH